MTHLNLCNKFAHENFFSTFSEGGNGRGREIKSELNYSLEHFDELLIFKLD